MVYKAFCEKCVLMKNQGLVRRGCLLQVLTTSLVGKQLVLPLTDFVLCSASLLLFEELCFLMMAIYFSILFECLCL